LDILANDWGYHRGIGHILGRTLGYLRNEWTIPRCVEGAQCDSHERQDRYEGD
jgi:hypothetical protein